MKNKFKPALKTIFNLAFLALFIDLFNQFSDINALLLLAESIPLTNMIIGFLALAATYGLRTHRFYVLLSGLKLPWRAVLKVMLQHNAINNLLPFRLGELSFPILLKKTAGIRYTSSAKVLITARLFDLLFMAGIAFTVTLAAIRHVNPVWGWYLLSLGLAGMLLVAAIFGIAVRKGHPLITTYLQYLTEHFKIASQLTFAIWALKILGLSLLLAPMLNTKLAYALMGVVTVEATAILPINGPANFGSLEGAVVAVLLPFGLQAEQVFSAILNLHIAIIMLAAVGYLVSIFIDTPSSHSSKKA